MYASCYHLSVGRIARPARATTRGIQVELFRTPCGWDGFVSVAPGRIPPCAKDRRLALLTMAIRGECHHFQIYRLSGGHKAQLPDEARHLLIDSLIRGDCVTLELSGYRETVKPTNFAPTYARLQGLPMVAPRPEN